jgi:hypothetical protein
MTAPHPRRCNAIFDLMTFERENEPPTTCERCTIKDAAGYCVPLSCQDFKRGLKEEFGITLVDVSRSSATSAEQVLDELELWCQYRINNNYVGGVAYQNVIEKIAELRQQQEKKP